jgi:hypothetical protein
MSWSRLVDMEMDDESQLDAPMPIAMSEKPRYPYGLRICFSEEELKKLDLEIPEIGDMIDMRCFATVTSVSMNDGEYGKTCRVELQIEKISAEAESSEKE